MKKENPEPATKQELDQNAAKTHEGGAAVAAEDLKEKSMNKSEKGMKSEQQNSDKGTQGQDLIKKQPLAKQ